MPYGNPAGPNSVPVIVSSMNLEEMGRKLDSVIKQAYAMVDEAKRDVLAARKAGKEIDKSYFMGQVSGKIAVLELLCKTMKITLRVKGD